MPERDGHTTVGSHTSKANSRARPTGIRNRYHDTHGHNEVRLVNNCLASCQPAALSARLLKLLLLAASAELPRSLPFNCSTQLMKQKGWLYVLHRLILFYTASFSGCSSLS